MTQKVILRKVFLVNLIIIYWNCDFNFIILFANFAPLRETFMRETFMRETFMRETFMRETFRT